METEREPFKSIPENTAIVLKLEEKLQEVSSGDTVSYEELSKHIGKDVRAIRWLLDKARNKTARELGCLFTAVRGVGIKRLLPKECPDYGVDSVRSVRRKSVREKKRLDRINPNSLTLAERGMLVAASSIHGAVAYIADIKKVKVAGAVIDPMNPIPRDKILAMLTTAKKD